MHQLIDIEVPPVKWSGINVSFLADFPKKDWGIGHEEEAVSVEQIVAVLK